MDHNKVKQSGKRSQPHLFVFKEKKQRYDFFFSNTVLILKLFFFLSVGFLWFELKYLTFEAIFWQIGLAATFSEQASVRFFCLGM